MHKPSILFQIPWANIGTPAAVNIWMKNISRSFNIAGFSVALQYFTQTVPKTCSINGIECFGIKPMKSWMFKLPKVRILLLSLLQKNELMRQGQRYDFIAPLGGPYRAGDERRKAELIKSSGAMYFHPILEHPSVRTGISDVREVESYVKRVSNLYDVLMPITSFLQELYIGNGRTKPTLLNPIVVDTNAIEVSGNLSHRRVENFVYAGNLSHGEEIELLLDSFVSVLAEAPASRLEVLGGVASRSGTQEHIRLYHERSRSIGIEKSVEFSGVLPHNEVIEKFRYADAFLLPRPFRAYSKAGFPSKLGEYLATGKPVITTATGDIPLYLEDGTSAYLVHDSSSESFSEKVIQCIMDSTSGKVGLAGRQVAEDSFSIEASATRIRSFFQEHDYFE